MAHFYGTLQGSRGMASRLGHASTGLSVKAASWQGAVSVVLYYDEKTGRDMARVALTTHNGAGVEKLLFDGRVDGAKAAKAAKAKTPRKANGCDCPAVDVAGNKSIDCPHSKKESR